MQVSIEYKLFHYSLNNMIDIYRIVLHSGGSSLVNIPDMSAVYQIECKTDSC